MFDERIVDHFTEVGLVKVTFQRAAETDQKH
jgi:hypothetical protein